jgi:copper chaperone CopZ
MPVGAPHTGGRTSRLVKVELALTGMHCSSCSALIEETLGGHPAVERANVDLEGARAEVVYDAGGLRLEELCAVVAGLGYGATPSGGIAAPA